MEPVLKIYQGDTKCDIRQKVWNYIEEKNLANFPRPVYNRIPNFKGAAHACNWLIDLQEFRSSRGAHQACSKVSSLESFTKTTVVKVDPDKPLEGVRLATLQAKKTLIVPTPRLRTGLFNRIVPPKGATKQELHVCSTSQGIKEFSVPIGLDDKVQVDLVVVGSVAVSDKGYRIGKGEGFADMEYAMMVFMGAVGESTVVVTIVHDCQVMDIPDELHESHDLTVDFILTPTRIIKTECKQSRSQGIIWSKLDNGVLQKIPILKKLRTLAQNTGKDFALKTPSAGQEKSEQSISLEQFPCNIKPVLKWEPNSDPKGEQKHKHLDLEGDKHARHRFPKCSVPSLYLGSIPTGLSVSELENLLREQDAAPLRVTWHGAHHRALLEYSDNSDAERALAALQNVSINGHTLCAQPVRNQRSSWRPQKNTKMAGRGGY